MDPPITPWRSYGHTPHIVIIDKPNGGVSSTRNRGMEVARGRYLFFVDSDDWIARNSFQKICEGLLFHQPVVLRIKHKEVYPPDWETYRTYFLPTNTEITRYERRTFFSCCDFIIKREVIENLRSQFDSTIKYGEDCLFMRDVFDYIRLQNDAGNHDIYTIDLSTTIYFYRINDGSAMQTAWTSKRLVYMDSLLGLTRADRERFLRPNMPE